MRRREEPCAICANEGCARLAEPDDAYCSACALERSLFLRDDRTPEPFPEPGTRNPEPGTSS